MGTQWISDAEMAAAERLVFQSSPRASITGWDNFTSTVRSPSPSVSDDFAVDLTAGATYRFLSTSAPDPLFLRVQNASGDLLAIDASDSSSGGSDFIGNYVATYTGIHYVSAGWNQPPGNPIGMGLQIEEDLDTVQSVVLIVRRATETEDRREVATSYSGPVSYLQDQFLGTAAGEVVIGSGGNDFLNLLGGDDAAQGGAGDDVLDGGTGSNFLSGGAGRDVFFLDGRGGATSWATITDWEGGEQLSLWGWNPSISKATWAASAGALGYRGVTLHADLDGNGTIDASVTWAGLTREQLPVPASMEGLLWFA